MFKVSGIVSKVDGTRKLDTKTGQFKKGVRVYVQSATEVHVVAGSLDDYKKSPCAIGSAYEFPVSVLPSNRAMSMPLFWLNGAPKEISISDLVVDGEETISIEQLLAETADDNTDVQDEVNRLSAPKPLRTARPTPEAKLSASANGTGSDSAADLLASVVK